MEKSELTFKLSGNQFSEENGYNLHYLSKGLSNFHTLIDKSYLTIIGKKKMSKQDRETLNIKAYNLRPGSFEADLSITLTTISAALVPMATSLSPKDIWDLSTKGLEYLKLVLSLHSKGEDLKVENIDSSLVNIVTGSNVNIIQVHPDVMRYAGASEGTVQTLAKMVNPEKGVEGLTVSNKTSSESDFSIGVEEKVIFENRRRLEKEPITFIGEIFDINGESFNGRVRVINGDDLIEQGEYRFEFFVKDNKEKLRQAFLKRKSITALKETILSPGNLERIICKLHIIQVD
ncbi:hypothetical protein [Halalkalibacter oceani]|uniref:hypothetical protein n=1 Tax=Halalkalibacter oceani TaxID=1653776 RepID=UPI003395145C